MGHDAARFADPSTFAQEPLRPVWYQTGFQLNATDNWLLEFERYASLVIKGGAKGPAGTREGNIVSVKGIHYSTFKLFLLSIIWRAGVARHTFFERVDLGPHQDRIRVMLKDSDPGPFDLYPCLLWGLNHELGVTPGLMIQPCRAKVLGYTTYHFVVPGLKMVFFVSSQRLRKPQSQLVLQEDGHLSSKSGHTWSCRVLPDSCRVASRR